MDFYRYEFVGPQLRREIPGTYRKHYVSLKSNLVMEYRRFSILLNDRFKFDDFLLKVRVMHLLSQARFKIHYLDREGELLPLNNDVNLAEAINKSIRLKPIECNYFDFHGIANPRARNYFSCSKSQSEPKSCPLSTNKFMIERRFLKIYIEIEGDPRFRHLMPRNNFMDNLRNIFLPSNDSRPSISAPENFRQISSIIEADIKKRTRRRVVLKRGASDKPLGFYIRDGTYQEMNQDGIIEQIYGVFISRLIPGGLAEITNLLAENDEILEVNGVEIGRDKRLDQVRDMMVANSNNLVLLTRPARTVDFPGNRHTRLKVYN